MTFVLMGSLAGVSADEAAWRSLPLIEDGRPAPGWKQIGWGEFVVDGDTLRTLCDDRGLGVLLYEKEKFGDCQIRIVFRPEHARSNSGVHIRMDNGILDWKDREVFAMQREPDGTVSEEMKRKEIQASEERQGAWYAVHHGYEIQLCDEGDQWHRTGAI